MLTSKLAVGIHIGRINADSASFIVRNPRKTKYVCKSFWYQN